MAHWLVKSEPFNYSWDDLQKDKQTTWEGVRNYAARNNLKAMKKGDEVLFYHSNTGMEIVGIAQVSKEYYTDPTATGEDWVVVDIKPLQKLKKAVTLKQVKEDSRLTGMALLRLSRLSVQPVTEEEWKVIMELAQKQ